MKSPADTVRGRIVGYDERRQELLIRAPYDDWFTLSKRGYKTCLLQLEDSRPLSDGQRRFCYQLLQAIAEHTGQGIGPTKELMKLEFLSQELDSMADKIFSLSNAPMSLVAAFQRYLIHFVLDWDVPCSFSLLDSVDDVADYVYHCLVTKSAASAGSMHNCTCRRVGMGRNREELIHEGMEALPLCGLPPHRGPHHAGQGVF